MLHHLVDDQHCRKSYTTWGSQRPTCRQIDRYSWYSWRLSSVDGCVCNINQ
jgi:hypothetical protein